MTMPDADIHTLAAPYALHALPADEVEQFEAHLGDCSACSAEVDEIRETAARLGSATAVAPPDGMREQVLARIRQIRPIPPDDSALDGHDGASGARARAVRRWWPRVSAGLVAAMAAGIVVLGIRLADVQEDLDRSRQVAAVAEAPDAEMTRVETDEGRGTALFARSLDEAVLIVDGMAPAPADHTYQLWFIGDDGARSAGVLGDVDDGDVGPFNAEGLGDAAQLGITVEPDGGSEQPTSDPVMVLDLPV